MHRSNEIHMSVPGAAIHIICPDHRTHESLKNIEFFIRASCRNQPGNRVRTMLCFYGIQTFRRRIQSLDPWSIHQSIVFSYQRLFETIFAIDKLEPESATNTQTIMSINRIRPITPLVFPGKWRSYTDDFRIFSLDIHLTTIATIIAGGGSLSELPRLIGIFGKLIGNRTDRADRQTIATKFAIERLIPLRHNLSKATLFHKLQRVNTLHVFANIDAFTTGNAAIHIEIEH